MQAIGSQVFIVLAFPLLAITTIIYLSRTTILQFLQRNFNYQVRIQQNQQQRVLRQRRDHDDTCSICLVQPKNLPVSSTCGHTFCGECIMLLFEQGRRNVVLCPLCRKEMTVLFKLFPHSQQTTALQQKLRQYNLAFDDNRPLIRRLLEWPYVWAQIRRYILDRNFLVYFIRSVHILRIIVIIIFYLLLPFDFIPEGVVGVIGFLDDFLIGIMVLAFFVMIAGIQYMRMHH